MRSSMFVSMVLAFVLALCAAASASDWIEFEIATYNVTGEGQRYDADIMLGVDGVSGAGEVQGQLNGAPWLSFDLHDLGGGNVAYTLETDEDLTLLELNNEISGPWKLKVTTASGDCVYDFSIGTVTAGTFAPIPVITHPLDGAANVPQDVDFQWTWSGNTADVDEIWTDVMPVGGGAWWAEDGSDGGSMNLSDTSWQPGLAPNTGLAWFCVGYDIYDPIDGTGLLSAISFDGGSSSGLDFGWDEQEADVCSDDEIEMTVVPEPASAMLLGLGALFLAARRKQARQV